jgi:flagellar hook-associated protein 3 FlgL
MISQLNASTRQFLLNLDRIKARGEKAQQQMSSGRRISSVSDEPVRVGAILSTGAELQRVSQVAENLNLVKAEVDTGEQALESAVKSMEQARTLGLNGANSLRTAAERGTLAMQVKNVLEQMVSLAGSAQAGRYLFSGDSEQTAPYQVDLSQPNGVTPYAGSASTRRVEDASGTTFPVGLTAEEIFDDPGGSSVFAAVNQLRVALEANDQTGVQAALPALQAAQNHLNVQLARFGNMQNTVTSAIDAAAKKRVSVTTALSGLADADIVEAALDFQNATLQQQAAMSARSMVPRRSLFDYLG